MLTMKFPTWKVDLCEAETGRVLRSATFACSTADKARDKARFRWGIDHNILIGTKIRVTPFGMRELGA